MEKELIIDHSYVRELHKIPMVGGVEGVLTGDGIRGPNTTVTGVPVLKTLPDLILCLSVSDRSSGPLSMGFPEFCELFRQPIKSKREEVMGSCYL